MKILSKIALLALTFILCISSIAFCATKEDVISAINSTYYVSEAQPSFRLPQKYITKGENYLNSHPLTSAQYSRILAAISRAVAFAREVGHTHYKKYTREQLDQALAIVIDACRAANVDLNQELANQAKEEKEQKEKMKQEQQKASQKTINNSSQKAEDNNSKNENTKEAVMKSGDNELTVTNSGDSLVESVISGEIVSGEFANNSGNQVLEDDFSEFISDNYDYTDYNAIINRNITIVFAIIISVIIFNIFIIRLIFKKKWFKIVKCIIIVILGLITIALIIAFGLLLFYLKEIKMLYELYYLLQ